MSPGAQAAPTIEVDGVSKWFGNVVAVNSVSLVVTPGITGLLGPNGAGKTTLLRMIAGLGRPSEGTVTILGQRVRSDPAIYERVGVMVEQEKVYDLLTGREFVQLAAELSGLASVGPAVDRAIARVNLKEAEDRKLAGYSRGMRQRIRLAATLVHDPEVVLLDEPLNGTDPRQRIEFQQLMRQLAAEGRTILISSHILEEVEALADNIILMVSGKLAASGDFHVIRAKLDERPYKVRIVAGDPRSMAASLIGLDEVDSVALDGEGALVVLSRNVQALQRSIPRLAHERSIRLLRVEPLDESLESLFSYLVEA